MAIENIETQAEIRSISPSGLAVLDIADPGGALHSLLTRNVDQCERVRLTVTADTQSIAVMASLVWLEPTDHADPSGRRLELFVDGSGSPQWEQLLALSRMLP